MDKNAHIRDTCIYIHTVNDRLNALGAYLKTKAFVWALI